MLIWKVPIEIILELLIGEIQFRQNLQCELVDSGLNLRLKDVHIVLILKHILTAHSLEPLLLVQISHFLIDSFLIA